MAEVKVWAVAVGLDLHAAAFPLKTHTTREEDSRLERHKAPRNIKVRESAPAAVLSNTQGCFMLLKPSAILLELVCCNKMPQKAFRATVKSIFFKWQNKHSLSPTNTLMPLWDFHLAAHYVSVSVGLEFYFCPWWLTACGARAKHVKATAWSSVHWSVSAGHWLVLEICQCL